MYQDALAHELRKTGLQVEAERNHCSVRWNRCRIISLGSAC
ncbi:MAG: hypothetical protein ACOCTG_01475 [Bacteroidota bacterium]